MKQNKTALGLEATLIYCLDGQYRVRIYDQNNNLFKDYDIKSSEFTFRILDEDCHLYEDGDNLYIGHSPRTLGKT